MRALKWSVLLAVLFVLIAVSMARIAGASGGGRVGFSGNPATNAGQNCTSCHTAGAATPAVVIAGPAVVNAGATNSYVVTITGGPGVTGGFNASTSGFLGQFSTVDAETEVLEITPSKSKNDRGIVYVETRAWNQKSEKVMSLRRRVLVPVRPATEPDPYPPNPFSAK